MQSIQSAANHVRSGQRSHFTNAKPNSILRLLPTTRVTPSGRIRRECRIGVNQFAIHREKARCDGVENLWTVENGYNLSCLQFQLPQGQSKHPTPYPQQKIRFHHAGRPSCVASPGNHSSYTFGLRGSTGFSL